MTDVLPEPDDFGAPLASEAHTSFSGQLGAEWANTLDPKNSWSGGFIFRRLREAGAGGLDQAPGMNGEVDVFSGQPLEEQQTVYDARRAAIPDTPIEEARARVKQEGLEKDLRLPDQPSIKSPVLDLMIQEAHDRRDREAAIARGPDSFIPNAVGFVTSMGVGMIDPVNAAAFSIPVLGEARAAALIARAGESIAARAGVKAGIGALQGAAGTALLQGPDWWLHTRDGQDYTFAEALKSVVMGAGIGGLAHSLIGGAGDIRSRIRGAPLEGSPEDLVMRGLMGGRHVSAEQLDQDGVPLEQLPGMEDHEVPGIAPAPHEAAAVIADLPPAAREDAVHAAMADVISGTPVRAAEVLQIAADHDPRIAESFEAWHGSPHDVERFDSSRIGTGEGAQTFGHGLYFAENEKVATQYARSTSGRDFIRKAQELYSEHDSPDDAHAAIVESKDFTPGQKRLLLALEKDDWLGFEYPHQAVSAALSDPNGKNWEMSLETLDAIKRVGNMYRVRIKADQGHFLDWDKPLSEQPEAVQRVVKEHGLTETDLGEPVSTGERVYHALKDKLKTGKKLPPDERGMYRMDDGREAASQALSAAGVHGIKYLDQGSRAGIPDMDTMLAVAKAQDELATTVDPARRKELQAELAARDAKLKPTRNFVVFDDKHIEITHKNGEPVKQAELPPRLHALSAEARSWPEPPEGARIVTQGDHGPELAGLEGRWKEAVDWLSQAQSGDARGVLEHPDVPGRIDVVWGNKAYGLEHIAALHPEMLPDLPERLARMSLDHVVQEGRPGERLVLTTPDKSETAIIRTGYDGGKKIWLLTAFTPESDHRGRGGDTTGSPSDHGPAQSPVPPEGNVVPDSSGGNARIPDLGRGGGTPESPADREPARSPVPPEAKLTTEPAGSKPLDRGAQLAAAAADPRWRELADVKPDYDEPEALEESRAADLVEEPASASTPERALTALEQEAKRAEEIWKQIEPTLTEKERALVNDVLDKLKLDKDARDKIISDGVACLVGAIG